jgi:hypothetical protein
MKQLSFELTMPNVGSWNGKWTGADRKYYIIKSVSDKFFKMQIEPLLEGKTKQNWHYSWNDGWGANVQLELIDAKEATKRRKLSKGFAGYDWMVSSIMQDGTITTSTERKKQSVVINNVEVPVLEVG